VPHSDDESLSLLALGEPVTAEVRAHVAGCDRCAAHVRELAALVGAVRADLPWPTGVQPVPPPPQVWSGIAAATGVRVPPRPSEVRRRADALAAATRPVEAVPTSPADAAALAAAPPATPPSGTAVPAAPNARPAPGTPPGGTPYPASAPTPPSLTLPAAAVPPASVVRPPEPARPPEPVALPVAQAPRPPRPAPRRGASPTAVFLAAAAALAIGLASGVMAERLLGEGSETGSPSADRVLQRATLDGLGPSPSAGGSAEVVQTPNGRQLDVQVGRLGSAQGYYEVWLSDPTLKEMVPVGILRGDSGRFELPDGVDLVKYRLVDISEEPLDGAPAHSGVSVLRGTIT
jgi:hypothetical protein